MGYSSKATSARMIFAFVSIMMGSELASAQSDTRNCVIINGVRHCDVPTSPSYPPPPAPGPSYPNYPAPNPPPPYYPPPPGYPQPPMPTPYYPAPNTGYNYSIQEFSRNEIDAVNWDDAFRRARPGSWDQTYAVQNRDQSIRNALNALSGYRALEGIRSSELENLALDLDYKFRASRSGSALQSMYSNARNAVVEAFVQAEQIEAQYARDFRDNENEITRLDYAFRSARAGSTLESGYSRARSLVIQESLRLADSQLRYMGAQELYQIQDQYHRMYQSARAGSQLESYYRQVRDLARSLLQYRP